MSFRLLTLLVLLASTSLVAEDWPQFRGTLAGVGQDHPDLRDTWSSTDNVVSKSDVPGLAWTSRVAGCEPVLNTSVATHVQQDPPKPGFYLGDWPASKAPHRWLVVDVDFATGKTRWQREVSTAPPALAKHLKTS